MSRTRSLAEPPVANRQAQISKKFHAVSKSPYPRGGRKPVNCAMVHLRMPDAKMQKAVIEAAREANVSVSAWLVAATRAALADQARLPLPEKPVKRDVVAEAVREQRERHEQADRKERLRLVEVMREEGLSESAIARVLGVSPSSLCHFLKKYGPQRGRTIDERFTRAIELIDAGVQMSEVARRLGTSMAAIKYQLGKRK